MLKSDQEPAIKVVGDKSRENLCEDMYKMMNDIKGECGCQILTQHSPVGESAANGAIENTIQRVQGQIRAIKLDVETNTKLKLSPSQAIWPWLIEYAAQTLLYWRVTGHDGLTAIQRIRGRSSTAPRPRFGEKVLYNVAKTVKLGKAEARWRYGVWLGSIEASDEHLLGTELGVIKARAVKAAHEDQRFDGKAIENIKGTPWQPSTKHKGTNIRTHVDEKPEQDDTDDEAEEHAVIDEYGETEETQTI